MQKIHIIGGPTASGKSAHALAIAQNTPAVIINADSMQLYAEFPILTAQPDATEQTRAPHRLYGILSAHEKADAAGWAALAAKEIEAAWAAGNLPLLVGGTGLYLRTLLSGIAPVPPVPKEAEAASAARLEQIGHAAFHSELAAKDPASAVLKIGDTQRMLRAHSVLSATGQPLAHWQSLPHRLFLPAGVEVETTLLLPPRAELYAKCDQRFDLMLANGAIEEVQRFGLEKPVKIIGVREIQAYLRGECTLEAAATKAKQLTRNYAKRQYTWFKNQKLVV